MDVVEEKDGVKGHWQTGWGSKIGMPLTMRMRHVTRASAESTHHCYRVSSLRCTADNPPSAFEHCGWCPRVVSGHRVVRIMELLGICWTL